MKCDVPKRPVIVLDACVLINLLASGRAEDILCASEKQFAVCSVVKNESVFLRSEDANAPLAEMNLDPFLKSWCLHVLRLSSTHEEALYVDYAAQLDDGEAMSLALVHSRGLLLATDDRKARRLFLEEVGDAARLLSTAAIFRDWSNRAGVVGRKLRDALIQVTLRGRFLPRADDRDYGWWSNVVG